MIPSSLIEKCNRNKFVWYRQSPTAIDAAFEELGLPKLGELYTFARAYCLQFSSDSLPFQLEDIVDDHGISDNVYYVRDELGVEPRLLPISTYEAESVFVVDVEDNRVLLLTPNDTGDGWVREVMSPSLYALMDSHLQ
ncbi:hypothetical protein [Sphingopyxis panaciterrae]